MKNLEEQLKDTIYNEIQRLKNENLHINDADSEDIKRQKDISFGKVLGLEEALSTINIIFSK